jgi:hypothetical protein
MQGAGHAVTVDQQLAAMTLDVAGELVHCVLPRHGSFSHRNAEDCITLFFKKELSSEFREFFKNDEQSGSHDSARMCAVGVPDFTGVEDIFRLTVGHP